MSQDFDTLIRSQTKLQGRIICAHNNLKKMGVANITQGTIEAPLQNLEANWNKFEGQHDILENEHAAALRNHEYNTKDLIETVEEQYIQQKAIFLDLLLEMRSNAQATAAAPGAPGHAPRTTLPRIQLPHFSGKYEDWPSFRDLFASIISRDNSLTNVKRLHYLKTSLKGGGKTCEELYHYRR
ncbi:hypothetical protein RF55_7600 [Lasius niger]|uniref:Uncharacterized protein n=1 Tax=Lasius niger TaxID=67767 RepID=A0A0J7NIT1_LASNI|nr:hypothetical protein RF55_7600 [Lasius niger]